MPAPKCNRKLKHFYEVPRDLLSRTGTQTRKHCKGLTGTLIVGDDTGLIKVVSCKKKKLIKLWGEQNPNKRIKKLYWAHPTLKNPQTEFLSVLSNGDVRIYDSLVGSFKTIIKQETNIQGKLSNNSMISLILMSHKKGLYVMENPCINEKNKRMIWTVNGAGDLRLWGADYHKSRYLDNYKQGKIDFPTDSMILNKLPKRGTTKHEKSKNERESFINLLKSQSKKDRDLSMERGVLLSHFNANTVLKCEKLQISHSEADKLVKAAENKRQILNRKRLYNRSYGYHKGQIKCIKGHYSVSQFPWIAIGGNDRPVQVFDFNKEKCIFEGKHHYHWLGHKHEIIINDIDWAKKSVNPWLCAAVTSQSELKLYDLRQNKSMLCQKIGDYALNKVMIKSKKKVLCGDANSNLWEFDYLKSAKYRGYVYRRYRGFVGGINDFDVHPTRNLIASVGVGRYAVVHRFNQPHLPLFRTYLKQKLNAVLFCERYDTKYMSEEEEEEEEKEKNVNEVDSQNEIKNDDDVNVFLEESESEQNEESKCIVNESSDESMVEMENIDELKEAYGYDTDELKEILDDLKASNDDDPDDLRAPPMKKRKL